MGRACLGGYRALALAVVCALGACGEGDSPTASGDAATDGTSGGVAGSDDATPTTSGNDDATRGGSGDDEQVDETGEPECTVQNAGDVCDDDNPCTVEQCNVDGECVSEPARDGMECDTDRGMAGVCEDGACVVDCMGDADCDDGNTCTIDSCNPSNGQCEQSPLDGTEAPVEAQTPGDCAVVRCEDGNEVTLPDSDDVANDDNDCTDDSCVRGVPQHDPVTAGMVCGAGGQCNGRGGCVECLSASDCTDLPEDTDCQTRTCIEGVCGQDFAPEGSEVNATLQTPGDCQTVVCDGRGDFDLETNDEDLPVDGFECTDDVCLAGVPSNPNAEAGTECGVGSVCNGVGDCVGCVTADDCAGESTFCQTITCESNVCGVDNAMLGLPLPPFFQTDNDCQIAVCDGEGNEVAFEDDEDLPAPDGNDCTGEACNNGLEQFPDLDIDEPCDQDGGIVCDGGGNCVECNEASQCTLAGECQLDTCSEDNECGTTPSPPGPCDDGQFCTLTDTCDGSGNCIGAGDPCPGGDGDGNCSESCDEMLDDCSLDDSNGSPCDDGLFCTGGDTCDGSGTCDGGLNPCPGPDGDGNCSESCDEGADNCFGDDPPGTTCDDNLFCTVTDECNASGSCVGTGDPCPGPDDDANCDESCDEDANDCTGSDPSFSDCNDGEFCTATDFCNLAGNCVGLGDPCDGPDGDGNCSESCDEGTNSCNGNDPSGTTCNDGLFCTEDDECDGDGACEGGPNPCDGVDGDGDCTETCREDQNDCNGDDPNGTVCDPGGIFGGLCAEGLCVGV